MQNNDQCEGRGFLQSGSVPSWPLHSLYNNKKNSFFFFFPLIAFTFSTGKAAARPGVPSPALSLTWDVLQPQQLQ